jgi:hypothetical protein
MMMNSTCVILARLIVIAVLPLLLRVLRMGVLCQWVFWRMLQCMRVLWMMLQCMGVLWMMLQCMLWMMLWCMGVP